MSKRKSRTTELPTMPAEIEALSESASFSGTTPLALAGRQMMAGHTRKLYAHLPGVLTGDDPHDIHQMRVATRRLRASLQSTASAYQPELVVELRKRLRALARALGVVRDLDVMLMRLRADAEQRADDDRDELHAAIEQLEAERDAAHSDLIAELFRKRTARLLRDLNNFLLRPLEDVQASDENLPLLVRHYAGSAIWRGYEAVLRFESVMPDASSEQLHQLRIACKHLRYTLELFAPALPSAARGLIKQVEAMQEHLGLIHDVDVAFAHLGLTDHHGTEALDQEADAAAESPGSSGDGVATSDVTATHYASYAQTRLAERARLVAEVEPRWQELSSEQNRSRLASLVAAL